MKRKALVSAKQPDARISARASLQPTLTGVPAASPVAAAAAGVTTPSGSQALRKSGQCSSSQPHAVRTVEAGATVATLHRPLEDQGSDATTPVR